MTQLETEGSLLSIDARLCKYCSEASSSLPANLSSQRENTAWTSVDGNISVSDSEFPNKAAHSCRFHVQLVEHLPGNLECSILHPSQNVITTGPVGAMAKTCLYSEIKWLLINPWIWHIL